MAFKTTITCTDVDGVGVFLHGPWPDPKNATGAKKGEGYKPNLAPDYYRLFASSGTLPEGTQVTCTVKGKTGERSGTATAQSNGNLSLDLFFKVETDGKVS